MEEWREVSPVDLKVGIPYRVVFSDCCAMGQFDGEFVGFDDYEDGEPNKAEFTSGAIGNPFYGPYTFIELYDDFGL